MEDRLDRLQRAIDKLTAKLDALKEQLDAIGEKVEAIEYRSLTEDAQEERQFDSARPLTLVDIRHLHAGSVMPLISSSVSPPPGFLTEPENENASLGVTTFESFEYRHDRVAENETTEWGAIVYGSMRFSPDEEWVP